MRALYASSEVYRLFLLNYRAQGVSRKNEQPAKRYGRGPQERGAQCSCIGCIGLGPALGNIEQHYNIRLHCSFM